MMPDKAMQEFALKLIKETIAKGDPALNRGPDKIHMSGISGYTEHHDPRLAYDCVKHLIRFVEKGPMRENYYSWIHESLIQQGALVQCEVDPDLFVFYYSGLFHGSEVPVPKIYAYIERRHDDGHLTYLFHCVNRVAHLRIYEMMKSFVTGFDYSRAVETMPKVAFSKKLPDGLVTDALNADRAARMDSSDDKKMQTSARADLIHRYGAGVDDFAQATLNNTVLVVQQKKRPRGMTSSITQIDDAPFQFDPLHFGDMEYKPESVTALPVKRDANRALGHVEYTLRHQPSEHIRDTLVKHLRDSVYQMYRDAGYIKVGAVSPPGENAMPLVTSDQLSKTVIHQIERTSDKSLEATRVQQMLNNMCRETHGQHDEHLIPRWALKAALAHNLLERPGVDYLSQPVVGEAINFCHKDQDTGAAIRINAMVSDVLTWQGEESVKVKVFPSLSLDPLPFSKSEMDAILVQANAHIPTAIDAITPQKCLAASASLANHVLAMAPGGRGYFGGSAHVCDGALVASSTPGVGTSGQGGNGGVFRGDVSFNSSVTFNDSVDFAKKLIAGNDVNKLRLLSLLLLDEVLDKKDASSLRQIDYWIGANLMNMPEERRALILDRVQAQYDAAEEESRQRQKNQSEVSALTKVKPI